VNYPSTEYLDVSFLDFFSFNIYLERQPDLSAYLGGSDGMGSRMRRGLPLRLD
jgi:hypothetical protein